MATNLSQAVADLARHIATDQVAQDMKNNSTFATKEEVNALSARLSAVEEKLQELISVAWVQQQVLPLSLTNKLETK